MANDSTEYLLKQAADGDPEAQQQVLARYRSRLIKLIRVRIDPRLAARFDPSDVVQETLLDAARNLESFLDTSTRSIYPWLRGLAMNRLIDLYRQHVMAERRSVRKEQKFAPSDGSRLQLVDHFVVSREPGPSAAAQRKEMQRGLREAIDTMEKQLREVLVMRYLEELSAEEIAEILGVNVRTVWRWHRLALAELAEILKP